MTETPTTMPTTAESLGALLSELIAAGFTAQTAEEIAAHAARSVIDNFGIVIKAIR